MAERHTHQGSRSGNPGSKSRPTVGRSEHLPVIAAGGCWCGDELGHDWPGKSDGAPHPRSA